ncbi:MAG: PAC2 family protein [Desulfomonile sp.]|nr:PAC2 family protein [Deltaproteobacteria bacterium]
MLVTWRHVPELREPVLIAGFYGWSNAGNVSSDTIQYLFGLLQPQVFATISDEPFANFTTDRPVARIENGIIHDLEPMITELACRTDPGAKHDLVLFLGREPHYGWPAYCDVLMNIMQRLKIEKLYTIGGVQDTVSHSGPAIVSVVCSSASHVAELCRIDPGIRAADYCGPVSIHSYLVRACAQVGIKSGSLWGHAPAYLQKNPRLVAKMVTIVNTVTGTECPVDTLKQKSIELDRRINEAMARDPNLKRFVETVERENESDIPSGSEEKIIRLDDFLRREPHKESDT